MKKAAESCERLLACAEEHGKAEGYEMWIGDLEDFLRAAFGLFTERQLKRFWDDPDVARTVQDVPEYEELAAEIYDLEEHESTGP